MTLRSLIKGFVAFGIIGAGFVGGFTFDVWRDVPRDPQIAALKLASQPPERLAAFLRPRAAHADGDNLPPSETVAALMETIRQDYLPPSQQTPPSPVASARPVPPRALDAPQPTRLGYAAIDGMLETLSDRYTEFIPPKEYKEMLAEQSGNFVGIGATLNLGRDKRIVIIEPIEGSPAARAGLLPGDVIVAVNGYSVFDKTTDEVAGRIRGEENTPVRLTIERSGKRRDYTLRRAVVNRPVVEARMEDPARKIGYIRLTFFSEQADTQFDHALEKLEKQGMRALVFDLRDNPGGLLNVAQDLASRFISSGPVVWVKEKNGQMSPLNVDKSKHRGRLSTGVYPVVVLVNDYSASAAEIVAGAIQDARAGTLVGTRTYGKGLVQTIIPLTDDSAVKITTQHYFTRDKHDINLRRDLEGRALSGSGGIVPNVTVPFTDAQIAAQQEQIRRDPNNRVAADRLDPQLQKGLTVARDAARP